MLGFLRTINDHCVDIDDLPSTLLGYYRFALGRTFRRKLFERFVDQWIYDICRIFLVTKLCKSDRVTVSRTLPMIAEAGISIDRLLKTAIYNCRNDKQARKIRIFLSQSTEDCKKKDSQQMIELFRQIVHTIYKQEAATRKKGRRDPSVLAIRLRALQAFDPEHANLPSPEEPQKQNRKSSRTRSDTQAALAA